MEDDGSPPSTSFQPQQLEDHGHLVRQQADPEATKALDHQECYDNHELAGVGFDASRDDSRPSGVEAESPQVLPGRSTQRDGGWGSTSSHTLSELWPVLAFNFETGFI